MKTILLVLAVLMTGCSTGVISAGPDTYMISASSPGLVPGGKAKAKAYREANEWCAKRGLVMMPVSIDALDAVAGQRMASAELVFRALKPGDAELKRPNLDKPDYIQRVQMR